jgi:hypothetical protein
LEELIFDEADVSGDTSEDDRETGAVQEHDTCGHLRGLPHDRDPDERGKPNDDFALMTIRI